MKTRPFGSVLLVLFLCVALTACGTETPNPTPQESETTTTTTTTAKPTTSTTSRTTTSAITTTTTADAYEVDRPLPAKDKRCLLLDAWGGEITLTFDKAMKKNGEVLWYYSGTIPPGDVIYCRVNADTETIAYVECDIPQDSCAIQKEDAQSVINDFLERYDFHTAADGINLSAITGRLPMDGEADAWWDFTITLAEAGGTISGSVKSYNGKLYPCPVSFLDVDTDKFPLLIPRWKSE